MISALMHMLKGAPGFVETTAFGLFQLVSDCAGLRFGAIILNQPGAQRTGMVALRLRYFGIKKQGLCRLPLCVNMPGLVRPFPFSSPS